MEDGSPGRSEELTIVNVREITFPDIFNFGSDKVTVRVFSAIFCSENIMAIKYWFACGAFAVRSHAVSNSVLYWKTIQSVQKELLCDCFPQKEVGVVAIPVWLESADTERSF